MLAPVCGTWYDRDKIRSKGGGDVDFYRKKIFPALAEGLWLYFLFLDLTRAADSTWIKFSAICLCCATALFVGKTTDGKLVATALCFTVGADCFLLVRNDHYTLGIALFLVVQGLYAYRLYLLRGRRANPVGLEFRFFALVLLLLGTACFSYLAYTWRDGLTRHSLFQTLWSFFATLLPLFYFANLCVNAAEAFSLGRKAHTFAWGLLLFILCDLCVGAYNLGLLTSFTWWGSWLFYLPSQVLIVLSQETESGRDL